VAGGVAPVRGPVIDLWTEAGPRQWRGSSAGGALALSPRRGDRRQGPGGAARGPDVALKSWGFSHERQLRQPAGDDELQADRALPVGEVLRDRLAATLQYGATALGSSQALMRSDAAAERPSSNRALCKLRPWAGSKLVDRSAKTVDCHRADNA
jgi:hypothetical protein